MRSQRGQHDMHNNSPELKAPQRQSTEYHNAEVGAWVQYAFSSRLTSAGRESKMEKATNGVSNGSGPYPFSLRDRTLLRRSVAFDEDFSRGVG